MELTRRTLLGAAPLIAGKMMGNTATSPIDTAAIEKWGCFEASFPGPRNGNPFIDTELSAEFRHGHRKVKVSGFYDGDGTYRVRFMPDEIGEWSYTTKSNRQELGGQGGQFVCQESSANNHGPVMVRDASHFCYADGTPHISVGTTCYAWAHQQEELEKQTLDTLRKAPFNKVRMCILPTESKPHRYPFARDSSGRNDLSRFDVNFFQHFDRQIQNLNRLGIEADLILFHPYDHLGYGKMPKQVNDRYLRYVAARFAAFRNVWWSMANEWDLIKTKKEPEWDNFFRIVQTADPYRHLLSIHYSKVLYDYSKPWITHLSLQSDDFEKTQTLLSDYQKPVVFDECKYEGNINRRWGNLSGHEMARRFWQGMMAGAYVGHGETYHSSEGTAWISGGGKLLGSSPQRISFLRKLFEESSALALNALPDPYYPCIFKQDEYYLYYFDLHQPADYEFKLSDKASFRADIIDPWEMTIHPVEGTYGGKCKIQLPGKPYLAVRFQRV